MIEVIRKLYDAGIDCGTESFQGAGIVVWVVGPLNRRIEKHFELDQLDQIPEWLMLEGLRRLEIKDATADRAPHDLLAELASARRKDAKRVGVEERGQRQQTSKPNQRSA